MMRLPSEKTLMWRQTNRSDILGSLQGSFNLDLTTSLGKTLTTGMLQTTTSATNTDLAGAPVGFKYFASKVWTVAGTKAHKNDGKLTDAFTVATDTGGTGAPSACTSDQSDLEVLGNTLYVTAAGSDVIYRTNDGVLWLTMNAGSGGSTPRMLCRFGNRLYLSSGQINIRSWDETRTVSSAGAQYSLTLDNTYEITFMKAASDRIWIGTFNNKRGRALVHEWDGSSSQVTRSYTLDAIGALSCVIKDDIPYIMDSDGRLLVWNTGTFTEVARLPVNKKYLKNPISTTNNRWIHPNGMAVHDDNIVMLISNEINDSAGSIEEFCPSGIWEYSRDTGLYHKFSPSYTPVGTTTITAWGQNRISLAGGIAAMKLDTSASGANGSLIAGATIFTTQSATVNGVFINDTLDTTQKAGYLVTSELGGGEPSAMWQKVYLTCRRLLSATDKIVVKYRTHKQPPAEMTITWTSTTTFTTTDANIANYAAGDEVEIIRGKGGGMCSHITAISNNAGTYTVTLDETHTGATSGTASARLQKWIKLGTIADRLTAFKQFTFGKPASWVQFKVFFLWTGKNEFEALWPKLNEFESK